MKSNNMHVSKTKYETVYFNVVQKHLSFFFNFKLPTETKTFVFKT